MTADTTDAEVTVQRPPWPKRPSTIPAESSSDTVSTAMDHVFVGFLVLLGVPLLVVSAPIWLPLMAVGWVVVKVMGRFDRSEPDEPKPLRHNPGDRQW